MLRPIATQTLPACPAAQRTARSVWFGSAGTIDLPAEEVAQRADVVEALVRLAVLADVEPAVRHHELEARAVDVVEALLVVDLVDAEHAEVRVEHEHAGRRGQRARRVAAALCSATPHSMKPSGRSVANASVFSDSMRSQSNTAMGRSGFASAMSTSAAPHAERLSVSFSRV